jgi:hypothetical protein
MEEVLADFGLTMAELGGHVGDSAGRTATWRAEVLGMIAKCVAFTPDQVKPGHRVISGPVAIQIPRTLLAKLRPPSLVSLTACFGFKRTGAVLRDDR